MKYIAEIDGLEFPIEILDGQHVRFGEQILEVDLSTISGQPLYSLLVNGKSYEAYVYPAEEGWQVLLLGHAYSVHVEDEREKRLRMLSAALASEEREFVLRAPMPGLVVAVPVQEGQAVARGDTLVILESMKMQNELKAPRSGQVKQIRVQPGAAVEQRQILLIVE